MKTAVEIPFAMSGIRANQGTSATHAVLLRITGGGYSLAPTAAKSNRPTTSNLDDTKDVPSLAATKERRGDLREIASGSVSSIKAEGGKSHDV